MMKRKLDAARIEEARRTTIKSDTKEAERREIQETISKNRRGERKVKVILPDKKPYAYQESKRIRVAAYCRVSTAEEAQMNSFEMQVQHFEQVISENPMYEKADIYKDEGISGTSIEKRKDFQRMIEDCKAGKIDLILTKSISRFGRNIVDILSTLKLLDELTPPVAVTFESEGISTAEGKNKLIISIHSALAELESQQKASRSSRASATVCRRACISLPSTTPSDTTAITLARSKSSLLKPRLSNTSMAASLTVTPYLKLRNI